MLSPNPAKKGEYVFFSGEGSDPDGGNVTCKWISSLSGELNYETSFSTYSLSAGEHIITLQVTDDEGSTASAQKTLTVTEAKNLIPTVRITSHDNGHKVTSIKVKISGIASDDDGSVTKAQVKVNDGDWTDAQGTTSWSKDISLEEGANTVSCRAFDDKNAESAAYSITLNCEISQEAIELKDEEIASASIGKGGEQLYFIDVPDTATVIVIKTEGGKGNVVNLYVSRDSTPSEQSYRAKSYRTSGDERIRIDSGPADGFDSKGEKIEFKDFQVLKGRYYILVAAEGNGGDYNLRARYLELRFPFAGKWEITRGYNTGSTHLGTWKYSLDFAQQGTCDDYGQPIVASESGTVLPIYSVPRNITTGYGRKVEIDFGDGYSSLQGHMASRCVRTGIKVQRGQEIGMLGDTGNCEGGGCIHNGAHQHFSFLKDSMSIAPEAMSSVAEQRKKGFLAGQSLTGDDVGNPSTFVIIDDQDAENDGVTDLVFECGYRNRMSWANGSGENKDSTAAMIWRSEIPESGKYSVYAHIPDNYATAQVNYFIIHKVSSASNQTAEETINVNQEKYEDIWVRLSPEEGWYFEKGTGGYVKLTNANVPTDKKVAFDAIMFTQPDWGSAGGEELPSPEICDGLDNDCNGEIDEGFDVGSSCAVGTGACERIGNKVCSDDGTTTVCDIATGDPSEEICDNIDNDCDGEIDEGFDVGALCAAGTGACERIGNKVCSDDGTTTVCGAIAGKPSAEVSCDGIDNDCNGKVDEVKDTVAPKAVAKDITAQLGANGKAAITPADVDNGSFDNCGIAKMVVSPANFTGSNIGSNTVTLTVVDKSGNKSTCTATVKVEDKIAPKAVAKNFTAQLDASGKITITAANVNNGSSDNAGIASMTISSSSFTCANIGVNKVTLTVIDKSGNKSTCTVTVRVEDRKAPKAIAKNITIQLGTNGKAAITPADVDNGSSDNCGIAKMSVSPANFTGSNIGPNKVTLTVIDNSGNKGTCKATVKVEDKILPIAKCRNIVVQLNGKGKAAITAANVNNGSSDNCGTVKMAVSPSSFTNANIGPNKVVLTVTDTSGNKSTCTATVTVKAYKK